MFDFEDHRDIRSMIECLTGTYKSAANAAGVSASLLKGYLQDKNTLEPDEYTRLLEFLEIEQNPRKYAGVTIQDLEPRGGYVFHAKLRKQTLVCYDFTTHGGDLLFSFEALPCDMVASRSYRFLVYKAHGCLPNLMVFNREDSLSKVLDSKDALLNYKGPKPVTDDVYEAINALWTCVRQDLISPIGAAAGLNRWEDESYSRFPN